MAIPNFENLFTGNPFSKDSDISEKLQEKPKISVIKDVKNTIQENKEKKN